jgi:uncharacterized protein YdeI (YjbR/CyaY-like superfamily)
MTANFDNLQRERHPMPEFLKEALAESGLWDDFNMRPAYQQNDYVGWIVRAKREETRKKRLKQMMEELRIGGIYMGMDHPPSRR